MGLATRRWAHCPLLAEEPLPAAHCSAARTEPLLVAVPLLAACRSPLRCSVLVGCAAWCSLDVQLMRWRPTARTHGGRRRPACAETCCPHRGSCSCMSSAALLLLATWLADELFSLKPDDDAWKRSTHASCPPLYFY
ncbi:hypothetical protein Dimus_022344 [Dionaea muscipula]